MQGNAVSCSVRPRVREKTPTTDRENEKCDRVKMRGECQDCGGGIFQYVIKWLIGLNIGGRCMGNKFGSLVPKQVEGWPPKTGGRWEVGPQNRTEMGD